MSIAFVPALWWRDNQLLKKNGAGGNTDPGALGKGNY